MLAQHQLLQCIDRYQGLKCWEINILMIFIIELFDFIANQ
jgi:hypothetical protein